MLYSVFGLCLACKLQLFGKCCQQQCLFLLRSSQKESYMPLICLSLQAASTFRYYGQNHKFVHPPAVGLAYRNTVRVATEKVCAHCRPPYFQLGFHHRLARPLRCGARINYVGKASLFRPPFGWFFRWLGGYPVDRSRRQGYVDAVVGLFSTQEAFAICIAPEGTRKRVSRLRTGFYYIAKGAGVPILMASFDWAHRQITVSAPFHPGEDAEEDFRQIAEFYAGAAGKYPRQGFNYRREPDLAGH